MTTRCFELEGNSDSDCSYFKKLYIYATLTVIAYTENLEKFVHLIVYGVTDS